jgi:hypothetical protein
MMEEKWKKEASETGQQQIRLHLNLTVHWSFIADRNLPKKLGRVQTKTAPPATIAMDWIDPLSDLLPSGAAVRSGPMAC